MTTLLEQAARCPYCGEQLILLVDESAGEQCYIEDCQVCCCPMLVQVHLGDDGRFHSLVVQREND